MVALCPRCDGDNAIRADGGYWCLACGEFDRPIHPSERRTKIDRRWAIEAASPSLQEGARRRRRNRVNANLNAPLGTP